MSSYTILDVTFESFEKLKMNVSKEVRGYVLAHTRRRDKFLDDEDDRIREYAALVRDHVSGKISDHDVTIDALSDDSLNLPAKRMYIGLYICGLPNCPQTFLQKKIADANIDPNDAERWGDEPTKKPYSEYTDNEKMTYIRRLAEQGFHKDLYADSNYEVRLAAYQLLGRDETAKQDDYRCIRLEAYHALGRDEQAKQDPSASIRFEAYGALGRDQSSAHDADDFICRAAQLYYDTVGKRADE